MRKTGKKSLLVLVMTLVMMFSASITVFASAADLQAWVGERTAAEIGDINKYITTDSSKYDPTKDAILTTKDGITYYIEGDDVNNALKKIERKEDSKKAQDQVSTMDDVFKTEADLTTAARILEPVSGAVSTVVGIAVVLITLLMTLNTAFDIAYIAFPVIRGKMIDSKNSGGGMAKKNADGSTSLRFVTDEAQFAVEQVTTQNNGGNAMAIYFKKRVVSYVLLAIMLFILLTGNISLITDLAVKVVMGLMEVLIDIAG